MPKIITKEFVDATFRVRWPNGGDDEYIDVRPLGAAAIRKIISELPHDAGQAEKGRELEIRCISEAITGWSGFVSPEGEALPYSSEAVRHIADHQPDIYSILARMVATAPSIGKAMKE